MRVADGLDAGTCFVNTYNKTDVAAPFGGFKQSGFGKDLGMKLRLFLRLFTSSVLIKVQRTILDHIWMPFTLHIEYLLHNNYQWGSSERCSTYI